MKIRQIALAATPLFLAGCGASLSSPLGLELLKGGKPNFPTIPAARLNHQAILFHGGKTLRFQIWTVVDSVSGRLEASGPLGIGLATAVWNDSSWQASLPGQSTLLQGREASLNLPVLNLRDVSPSRLLAPFLGRGWIGKGPYQTVAVDKNQTLLLSSGPAPHWSLLLDNQTGLPLRRQTLSQGKEVEAISFFQWRSQQNILVPGRIVRTTPDGQRLELELKDWSALTRLPEGFQILKIPPGTDTITVGTGENGRKFYQVSPLSSDPASHQAPPADEPDDEDSGEWDDESSSDTLAPAQVDPTPAPRQAPGKH